MSSFRKRKNPIVRSSALDVRIVNRKVGEQEFVSTEIPSVVSELLPLQPSLDDMLRAGVSVKEVATDGILDSYDENDYPMEQIMEDVEKVVNASKKTSKNNKKGDDE